MGSKCLIEQHSDAKIDAGVDTKFLTALAF